MSDKPSNTGPSPESAPLTSSAVRRDERGGSMVVVLIALAVISLVSVILSGVALGRPTSPRSSLTITVTSSGTAKGTPIR